MIQHFIVLLLHWINDVVHVSKFAFTFARAILVLTLKMSYFPFSFSCFIHSSVFCFIIIRIRNLVYFSSSAARDIILRSLNVYTETHQQY